MKKKISITVLILGGLLAAWFGYQSMQKNKSQKAIESVLPQDFVYLLKTNELTDAWREVSQTNIWHHFIQTKGFEYLQSVDTLLNQSLLESKTTRYIFKNRPTAMAAYVTGTQSYDFIYVIDLQSTQYIKQVFDALLKVSGTYKVRKLTYNQTRVLKLVDKKDPKNVTFISSVDNLLLVSFSYPLLQKILDDKAQNHLLDQPDYQMISGRLEGSLIQFYFNYKQLPQFARIFFTGAGAATQPIAQQLRLSGFDINHAEERIVMDGYTLTDSIPSYLKALLDVKPGKMKSDQIISKRAAMYFSLGFKSFNLFYQSLLEQYAQQGQQKKDTYRKQLHKLESFFKIDLQKDLFDWIGQEISMVKIATDNPQKPADLLMLIGAKDIKAAQKGLLHITEQVRKRSPFKFKTYMYKNFPVNYIHQKRFFKAVLGDLFDKIDKPYYTFIEDYVVFSNSENVLKNFIDDYITGKTLSHDADFTDFKDEFSNKSNVFLYMQMPKLYRILERSMTSQAKQSLTEKKDLLLSFSRIGLELIAKDDLFKTLSVIDHDEKALAKEQAEQLVKKIDKSVHNTYFEDLQFRVFFPDSLQVADGVYRTYFDDGKTIALEGHVKDNLPQGVWRAYYASGNLKSVVNYKDGAVQGDLFYYFDQKPETLMVETHYEEDILQGNYLEYWKNGAQKAKLHYKDGQLNGEAYYYYPTGKLKIKGKYKKGAKKGKWLFYDKNGKVINKKRYSGFLF